MSTPPEHVHQWATQATWPSGPGGETDRLVQCTVPECGFLTTRGHDESDDGLTGQERAFLDRLDRWVTENVDTEALLSEIKRRNGGD